MPPRKRLCRPGAGGMREQGEIEVELAAGKAFLRDESPRPLILRMAGHRLLPCPRYFWST